MMKMTIELSRSKPERLPIEAQASVESYMFLSCQFGLRFKLPGRDGRKEVPCTGRCDYSYSYGSPEDAETDLIVVETKKRCSASTAQSRLIGNVGKYKY